MLNFFPDSWDYKTKPQILCQPNVPKPLHGLNPRTIKGQEWWDIKRQQVYQATDYHCIACGVHKEQAKKLNWLEAHEFWETDYQTGQCTIVDYVPLCHYCHNFIHSGRLLMLLDSQKITKQEVIDILEHGFRILYDNNLNCFFGTKLLAEKIGAETLGVEASNIDYNKNLVWSDFHLVFEGEKYFSNFKNEKEWLNHYKTLDKD